MRFWRRKKNCGQDCGQKGEKVVSRIFTSWNQLESWLRDVDGLRRHAA
jgi:hypothetical protein